MSLNINPTLPQIVPNTGLDVENVVNPNFQATNLYLKEIYEHSQRGVGGGWTSDEIADSAVQSRNIDLDYGVITNASNGVFNNDTAAFAFRSVFEFNYTYQMQQLLEVNGHFNFEFNYPNSTALIKVNLERSSEPLFLPSSRVVIASKFDSFNHKPFFNYNDVPFNFFDSTTKSIGSITYYRIICYHERNGASAVTNGSNSTIIPGGNLLWKMSSNI